MFKIDAEVKKIAAEAGVSLAFACAVALVMPADRMKDIQEMLVTALAIIAGAAIPGLALTAAAQRPPVDTPLAAERLGARLEDQVKFWFGFLLFGGAAIGAILFGAAMNWSLPTPARPSWLPSWLPSGGAWLVLASALLTAFTAIRAFRIVRAVTSLVRLGTAVHVQQTEEHRRRLHDEVAEQIRTFPPGPPRGVVRERHGRRAG